MLSLLLVALTAAADATSLLEASHTAVQLGSNNLTAVLSALEPDRRCLIEFYASWCPACQHFAPTYEKLAQFLKDRPLAGRTLFIGRVDCAAEMKLCGEFEVPNFPCLFLGLAPTFAAKQHKQLSMFHGNRELPGLVSWIGSYHNTTLTYSEVQQATAAPQQAAQLQGEATRRRPLPNGPEWSLADVEGATVQLWKIITMTPLLHRGYEKRAALKDVLATFAVAHPSGRCKAAAAKLAESYDALWPQRAEEPSSKLLHSEVCGPAAELAFQGEYVTCRGSKPETRGYSCGLWLLLHTMAWRLPEQSGAGAPSSAMMAFLLQFNKHFFLCEPCQKHFGRILTDPDATAVKDRRALVLWLWAVHNSVNLRLRGIETKYGHSTTGDPEYPKEFWPAPEACPRCRAAPVASPEQAPAWVEDEVAAYLLRVYGPASLPGADQGLKAATTASGGRQLDLGVGTRASTAGPFASLPVLVLPTAGVFLAAALFYCFMRSTAVRRRVGSRA